MDLECLASDIRAAGGFESYYVTIERELPLLDHEHIVREAARRAHTETYRESMTMEEIDDLSEGVIIDKVRDPTGARFYSVNVGPSGGAQTRLFREESTMPEPFMIFNNDELYPDGEDKSYWLFSSE